MKNTRKLVDQFMSSFKSPSTVRLKRKCPRLYKMIITKYPGSKPLESIYRFVNHMEDLPKCQTCNITSPRFVTYTTGYKKYCSRKCIQNSPEVNKKRRETMIERHGVPYAMQSDNLKEKYQTNFVEKYGVHHPSMNSDMYERGREVMMELYDAPYAMQSDELKDRHKKSLQETYGEHVTVPLQAEEVREKFKETCLEKYGVEYPAQIEFIFNKVRETNIERYGYPLPIQNSEIKNTMEETMFERYGVRHATQNPEIMERVKETNTEKYGVPYVTQNPEIIEKVRKTHEDNGKWTPQHLMDEARLYYNEVIRYTNKQDISKLKNIEHRGKAGIKGAYHLDHMVSIHYGFLNNVPAYIIGNIKNLTMLPWHDNIYKSAKCSIDPDYLIEAVNLN